MELNLEKECLADPLLLRPRRVLSLRDLVVYGVVAVTPSAPVTIFGLATVMSRGHAVLTVLIAMVAVLLTAVSYGRMAALYPSAGSAYTYVARGLSLHLGFLTGWAMLLDYLVIPVFGVIYGSLTAQRMLPQVPFASWSLLLTVVITAPNLWGIKATARTNLILLAAMVVVLIAYEYLAITYIVAHHGWQGLFSLRPFYDPKTFSLPAIASATSFAALTYLGFDAVTTLAEEVENPRRNVLLALVIVCVFTGLFGGSLIYLAQLAVPEFTSFAHPETAFLDVAKAVGGPVLFSAMGGLLFVAFIAAAFTSVAAAARLLFGLGRDQVLPRAFFARLSGKSRTPVRNILFLGVIAFVGSLLMDYELTAEILNFGAFLGFMGVNLATIRQFYLKKGTDHVRRFFPDLLVPFLGFLFCLFIWLGLSHAAKLAGGIWFILGFVYLAVRTRGFRLKMQVPQFSGD
jgi:putrescine importer